MVADSYLSDSEVGGDQIQISPFVSFSFFLSLSIYRRDLKAAENRNRDGEKRRYSNSVFCAPHATIQTDSARLFRHKHSKMLCTWAWGRGVGGGTLNAAGMLGPALVYTGPL